MSVHLKYDDPRVMGLSSLVVAALMITMLIWIALLINKGDQNKPHWACWDEVNRQMPSGTEHICAWIVDKPPPR